MTVWEGERGSQKGWTVKSDGFLTEAWLYFTYDWWGKILEELAEAESIVRKLISTDSNSEKWGG